MIDHVEMVVSIVKIDHDTIERKEWYTNGQLSTWEFFRNGKREGERKSWRENGQLCEQAFYRDGKLEGKHMLWYENGNPYDQSFYRTNKRHGEFKFWHLDGQILVWKFFIEGMNTRLGRVEIRAFLRIMKNFRRDVIRSTNTVLISDLIKIIS